MSRRQNNNAKTSAKTLTAQQRDTEALKLKTEDPDISWQAIADQFGYASKGAAFKQVMKLHRNAQKDASDEFRETWDAQFSFALDEVRTILDGAYELPDHIDPDDEEDTIVRIIEAVKRDGKLKLEAIDRLLKINERMAKMHGYDAPTKTEISGAAGFPISVDADLLPPQAAEVLRAEAMAAEAEARGD